MAEDRRGGAKGTGRAVRPLTRERVITAAQRFIDRRGVEQLTLRALAGSLGVTPMALYHHVSSKDDLLGAVIDRLMADLPMPRSDGLGSRDWEGWLAEHARQLRCFLLQHQNVIRLLVTPPIVGPGSLMSLEGTAKTLEEAGFAAEDAATATTLYNNVVVSTILWEAWRNDYGQTLNMSELVPSAYWKFDYRTLDRSRFPFLSDLSLHLNAQRSDDQFELALEAVISAIRATCSAPVKQARSEGPALIGEPSGARGS